MAVTAPPRLAEPAQSLGIPFREFVALTAFLMALTALSIDIMLPALPEIGARFRISNANDQQAVVTTYLLGFAAGQLFYGPVSDHLGRRPVLLAGLAVFVVGTAGAIFAESFAVLLAARAIQGMGAAAPRVVAIAVVRDWFSGRQMAKVMSLVMMTFIVVPVFAPAMGQALMHFGSWRPIFYVLLFAGLIATIWAGLRLPAAPRTVGATKVSFWEAVQAALTTRQTLGYMLGLGFMFGCLMSYIGTAEQIFVDVYDLGARFPLVFGAVASIMAAASFANSRCVERVGMRRLSHSALTVFVLISLLLCAASFLGTPPLWVFAVLVGACFFLFGLIAPNFNALAMQPLPHIAGTAASLIGFYSTGAAAAFGWLVGHFFDGTVWPLSLGFAGLSAGALAVAYAVEGRNCLFPVWQKDASSG